MTNGSILRVVLVVVLVVSGIAVARAERAVFETDAGQIVVELDRANAPRSAEAFMTYARAGQYDGTIFHRVVKGRVVQGGNFLAGPDTGELRRHHPQVKVPRFDPETRSTAPNRRGTLAATRGIPGKDEDSAPVGFFFNMNDNPHLDHQRFDRPATIATPRGEQSVPAGAEVRGYAVIGRVVSGMEVLERIQEAETSERYPHRGFPDTPVTILRVRIQP